MNAKAYNLLWVAPKFPPPHGIEFNQPIPDDTVKNMLGIAQRNANVDVRLWVDSKRYTEPQMEWLGAMTAKSSEGNMSLQDLRTIPTYDQNAFYNEPDNSESWRFDKSSLIWRQVDAARVLVCLQGDYEQSFYSDGDVTNLNINSEEIQKRIKKDGVVLSGWVSENGFPMYENQMFGFNRERRALFKGLYENTIHNVMTKGENGYASYINFINQELKDKAGIDTREVVFESRHDGTVALHPGEQVRPTDLPPAEGSGWRK